MTDWTVCLILGALIAFIIIAGIIGAHALNDNDLRFETPEGS